MTRDDSQESGKPLLDAEGFQRLLAAAYILQSYKAVVVEAIDAKTVDAKTIDARPSDIRPVITGPIDATPIDATPSDAFDRNAFTATAIQLKRVPFNRESPLHTRHIGENIAPRLTGLRFWKQVEAVGITLVFCLMMGMSIHRLLASSARTSQDPASLETREAALPSISVPKVAS
jgi:hypothetical protein